MLAPFAAYSLALILSTGNQPDVTRPSANLKISEMTAVPGKTLPPGAYTIRVLDHLSDRYIVEVDGANGSTHTLFIGIPNKTLSNNPAGEIAWKTPTDGANYIRGWKFASTPPLEFAYPKNDAVAVAKANGAQVPAIDPESDNILNKAQLSQDEMHIVTLWLLTPTTVGPNAPAGISAAKLSQVASNTHRPAHLPKTASTLPLAELLGALSLLGALGLRTSRAVKNR